MHKNIQVLKIQSEKKLPWVTIKLIPFLQKLHLSLNQEICYKLYDKYLQYIRKQEIVGWSLTDNIFVETYGLKMM